MRQLRRAMLQMAHAILQLRRAMRPTPHGIRQMPDGMRQPARGVRHLRRVPRRNLPDGFHEHGVAVRVEAIALADRLFVCGQDPLSPWRSSPTAA